MILTTDGIKLTSSTNYPFMAYAGQALASLIHMVNMCPDFYTVTYQRERIVRVEHIGGEFSYFLEPYVFGRDEDNEPEWHTIDDPSEFASFCSSIHVERETGIGMEVVGIEEWIKFGSVE